MTTKFVTFALLLAFGWAIFKSASGSGNSDRLPKPKAAPTTRQIKVLSEDATHRRIKHALGETDVPIAPQRIASLITSGTDGLLALGVKPILVTSSWKDEAALSYLAKQLEGVATMRQTGTLNLEEIVSAKPDLILAGNRDGRYYAQLSKIAPTVCLTSDASAYCENRILDIGDIVGKHDQATQRLTACRDRIADARQSLATNATGESAVFLRFRQNTCVIYTQGTMFGPLLFDQLGLKPDPMMPVSMSPGGWDVFSVERISTLQADHIFIVIDPDSTAYFSRVASTPIWRDLPAVQHDHVHRVVSSTWLGGDGILGCEAIVSDVVAAMVPSRSSHALQ